MVMGRDDHEIYNGTDTVRFRLIRDENGAAMYNIENFVPQYRNPLRYTQSNWIDGHGQHDFRNPDAYFEGQSIDTTIDGKIFLGPLLQEQKEDDAGSIEAPVGFCWEPTVGKLFCYTASHIYRLDSDGWDITGTDLSGVTDLKVFGVTLFAARGHSTAYSYSTDGDAFTASTLTDNKALKFIVAPNAAGTAQILWKYDTPNEIASNTSGINGGAQWTTPAYIGDTANDITNLFLVNDNFMVGKTDGLFHYDSDGGVHPLRPDLRSNRSTDNFKYVTEWQAGIYHSEIDGMGEITSYNAYEPMGPLTGIDDIGWRGDIVGLAADKDWIYAAIYDGTYYYIFKGREVRKQGVLRWQWCPFIYLGTNATACLAVVQESTTVRKLYFGYGAACYYVVLSDNPLADSTYKYTTSGHLRMSYDYGTDPEWDKMWQSAVIEAYRVLSGVVQTTGSSGETVQIKYWDDTDTGSTSVIAAATTVGVYETNFSSAITNNRVQFEIHLASDTDTATPVVSYFQAKGIEKPVRTRVHQATYTIGDEPTNRAKTLRDFFRTARTTTTLLKFADLRYGETTGGTAGTDYVYCVLEPESPEQVEIIHRKDGSKEMGIRVRLREVSFS